MTRYEAIKELLSEERNQRPSRTSMKRVLKACHALQITTAETQMMLSHFNYTDRYGKLRTQFEPKTRAA